MGNVEHLDRATLNNRVGEKKFDDNVQTDPEELPSDPSVVNFPKWVSSDGLVNAVGDVFATLGTAVRAGLRDCCTRRGSAYLSGPPRLRTFFRWRNRREYEALKGN